MRPLTFLSRSAATALSALLLVSGAVPVQAKETAAAAVKTASPETGKPGLWVLKDEDTTIYLFGTVHFLRPTTQWQNSRINQAFASADTLILEVNLPENQAEMAQAILPLALAQNSPPLSQRLSAADRAAYHAALAKYSMPATAFDAFKPWFAATTLSLAPTMRAGYNAAYGVEQILTNQAKAQNKAIAALETLEQQLGYFDMLPTNLQIRFLNESVKSLDTAVPLLDQMVQLWQTGKMDELATLMNKSLATTPEFTEILLDKRNEDWAEKLQKQLEKPGTAFVAVGSGHLAGDKSVQHYLAQRGLTVRQIIY